MRVDVEAEYADGATRLVYERGDDPDRRCLAGAVRAEQGKKITLLDDEVDALQGL